MLEAGPGFLPVPQATQFGCGGQSCGLGSGLSLGLNSRYRLPFDSMLGLHGLGIGGPTEALDRLPVVGNLPRLLSRVDIGGASRFHDVGGMAWSWLLDTLLLPIADRAYREDDGEQDLAHKRARVNFCAWSAAWKADTQGWVYGRE